MHIFKVYRRTLLDGLGTAYAKVDSRGFNHKRFKSKQAVRREVKNLALAGGNRGVK